MDFGSKFWAWVGYLSLLYLKVLKVSIKSKAASLVTVLVSSKRTFFLFLQVTKSWPKQMILPNIRYK